MLHKQEMVNSFRFRMIYSRSETGALNSFWILIQLRTFRVPKYVMAAHREIFKNQLETSFFLTFYS
jgi:hypothetical protein